MSEVVPITHLKHKIDFIRSSKEDVVIVATNGCFDILHIGHIRSLQKAKRHGDILVIGINSDESVKRLKGNDRPINNENERAEFLAALEPVDMVTIFEEDTAENFLDILKPDVYVKGSEYDLDELAEAKVVKKHGGRVINTPLVPGKSTTNLLKNLER